MNASSCTIEFVALVAWVDARLPLLAPVDALLEVPDDALDDALLVLAAVAAVALETTAVVPDAELLCDSSCNNCEMPLELPLDDA